MAQNHSKYQNVVHEVRLFCVAGLLLELCIHFVDRGGAWDPEWQVVESIIAEDSQCIRMECLSRVPNMIVVVVMCPSWVSALEIKLIPETCMCIRESSSKHVCASGNHLRSGD